MSKISLSFKVVARPRVMSRVSYDNIDSLYRDTYISNVQMAFGDVRAYSNAQLQIIIGGIIVHTVTHEDIQVPSDVRPTPEQIVDRYVFKKA